MADAIAHLSNYRQSPRKVGRVADMVRGKRAVEAIAVLEAMSKRPADPIAKLIRSAIANARVKGIEPETLVISQLTVGKGMVMKRTAQKARGSASLIRKKMSHVHLELTAQAPKAKKKRAPQAKKTEAAEATN